MRFMTALAKPTGAAVPARIAIARTPAGQAHGIEVFDDLAPLEPVWRELQETGVSSPYQRFDWARAYINACAAAERFEPRILVVRNAVGRAILLLPLAVERRAGCRIARLVGGKQVNYGLPLWAPGDAPTAAELKALLHGAGARLGLDAYAFANLPLSWRGAANPLAEEGRPSPSDGYRLRLDPDPDATLKRAFGGETRKKLRSKERKLREIGEIRHVVAATGEEAEAILQAFFRQKRERFGALGIANPFEEPATQDFLRAAALAGLARGEPAVELHALCVGERIVATFGAAVDGRRCCGMINSFDSSTEIARSSPGDLLLQRVIEAQCGKGRNIFDLGVGEARYKDSICDETEPLVDAAFGVTLRGHLYVQATAGFQRAKRFVKRTPWAWRLAQRVRVRRLARPRI
jgi:CelD/BcsL family acetyltransferase involved in cellulose biosynthesis